MLCVCVQVNVIPVIAKADTISRSELTQFKARVRIEGVWVEGRVGRARKYVRVKECVCVCEG